MRRVLAVVLATASSLAVAGTAPAATPGPTRSDNLMSPLQIQQQALREKGLALKASGAVGANATVAQVGKGKKAK